MSFQLLVKIAREVLVSAIGDCHGDETDLATVHVFTDLAFN